MPNVLIVPASGAVYFDNSTAGGSTVPNLTSTAATLKYDGGAGVNITGYSTSNIDRFSVDGSSGRLFSVSDALTGTVFSVNDAAGLPIIEVNSTTVDIVKIGTFNTNAIVVSGSVVGIGTATPTERLTISGNVSASGTITALGGNSNLWNNNYTITNTNSGKWESNYSTTNTNSANWSNVYTSVRDTSGNWNSAKTTVNSNSANWDLAYGWYTGAKPLSGKWESVYTTVNTNSAGWESVESTVFNTSASWVSTRNTVNLLSGDWESTHTTVNTNSGKWESVYASYRGVSGGIVNGISGPATQGRITYTNLSGGSNNVDINNLGTTGNPQFNSINVTSTGYFGSNITTLSSVSATSFIFHTAPDTTTALPGEMNWNSDVGTVNIGMGYDGVMQQVGLETYIKIKAKSIIPDGTPVWAVSAVAQGNSGLILAENAKADGSMSPKYLVGVATQPFAQNDQGFVTTFGNVSEVNLSAYDSGETWAIGDVLYPSPLSAGQWTKIEPQPPYLRIPLAMVLKTNVGNSNVTLMVRRGNTFRLEELHNVFDNGYTHPDGSVLAYSTAVSGWFAGTTNNITVSGITASGTISSNKVITTLGGNSNQWNSVYTNVNLLSNDWESTHTTVNSNSANWNSTRTTVNTLSNDWNSTRTTVNSNSANWDLGYGWYNAAKPLSGKWESVYTNVNTNSAGWESVESTVFNTSASWVSTRTTVNSNSGTWNTTTNTVNSCISKWESAYNTTSTCSLKWDSARTTVNTLSNDWNSTRTTVNSNSANWDLGYGWYTGAKPLSSKWESNYTTTNTNSAAWVDTKTTVNSNSGKWDSVYTTVNTSSGTWGTGGGGGGAYLPLSGGTINGSLTVTGNISGGSQVRADSFKLDFGEYIPTTSINDSDVGLYYNGVIFKNSNSPNLFTRLGFNGSTTYTDDFDYYFPTNDGYLALTQNSTGKPDDIIPADGPTTRTNLGLGTSNDVEFNNLKLNGNSITLNGTSPTISADNTVRTWSFTNKSVSVNAVDSSPHGVFFSPNGANMYVVGTANDRVNHYLLSTPWDLATATYNSFYSVATQDNTPTDLYFSSDGTNMLVVGQQNDRVYHYKLTTAWIISAGVTYIGFKAVSEDGTPTGVDFSPNGQYMYVVGNTNDTVRQYNLSAGFGASFNIASATLKQTFSVAAQEGNPGSIWVNDAGNRMYIIGADSDRIREYWLTNAFQVSSATYKYISDYLPTQYTIEGNFTGLYLNDTVGKAFVVGDDLNTVYEINAGKQLMFLSGKVWFGSGAAFGGDLEVSGGGIFGGRVYSSIGFSSQYSEGFRLLDGFNGSVFGQIQQGNSATNIIGNQNGGIVLNPSVAYAPITFNAGNVSHMRLNGFGGLSVGTLNSTTKKLAISGNSILNGDVEISGNSSIGKRLVVQGTGAYGDNSYYELPDGLIAITDTFTETVNRELSAHTSDSGTAWTRRYSDTTSNSFLYVYTDGTLRCNANGNANQTVLYTSNQVLSSADYEVKIEVTAQPTTNANIGFYLVARYVDNNNFYAVLVRGVTSGAIVLYKRVGGTYTVLGSYNGPVAAVTKNIAFRVVGNSLTVLDGTNVIINAIDSSITDIGYAGIGNGAPPSTATGVFNYTGFTFTSFYTTYYNTNYSVNYIKDGKVGINTVAPTEALTVAGNIATTGEIKITGGNYELDFTSLYGSALQFRVNETLVTPVTGLSAAAVDLIPAGAFVIGTVVRVVSAITSDTGTSFSIGDGTDIDKWGSGIAFTLNTTTNGTNFTTLLPSIYPSNTSVVLTPDSGSFTGGQVRVAVHYISFTAPSL